MGRKQTGFGARQALELLVYFPLANGDLTPALQSNWNDNAQKMRSTELGRDQQEVGGGIKDNRKNQDNLSAYHLKLFTWVILLFYSQQPYKGGTIILAIW